MSNIIDFFDELGPEKVIHFYNASSGLKAVLVIDNSAFGTAAGGIRMAPDITLNEMLRLARMMTYKFISYGLPMGGAKSGIWFDPNSPERDKMILDFAFEIKSFIKAEDYYPGPDIGTYMDDIIKILKICGSEDKIPTTLDAKKFGLPIEETFTGYGVVVAANSLLKLNNEHLKGKKVALEGFGKVGSSLASFLGEIDSNLVALSTIKGAIYNEDGLDIKKLIELKLKFGDDLINHYENAELIPKEDLFTLPVDVLIPGARPDVINKQNINDIKAKLIVPAANIPFSPDVIPLFNKMEFEVIPDFIANSGEILASAKRFAAANANEIYEYIKREMESKILELTKISSDERISIYDAAINKCNKAILRKFKRKAKKRMKQVQSYTTL